jgi:hypothetical protein
MFYLYVLYDVTNSVIHGHYVGTDGFGLLFTCRVRKCGSVCKGECVCGKDLA